MSKLIQMMQKRMIVNKLLKRGCLFKQMYLQTRPKQAIHVIDISLTTRCLICFFSTFFEYHMSMVFFLKYVDILPKRSADYENIKLSGMTVNNFFLSFENFRKQKNFFFVAFFFRSCNVRKYDEISTIYQNGSFNASFIFTL